MNLDSEKFLFEATKEISLVLRKLIAKYPDDKFYAFVLSTDNDLTSVYPRANTENGLNALCDDEEDREYFKWNPEEWSFDIDGENLQNTNEMLNAVASSDTREILYPVGNGDLEDIFRRHKHAIVSLLSQAMSKARKKFGDTFIDTLFFVNINDAKDDEIDMMVNAAKRYNSGDILEEFINAFSL